MVWNCVPCVASMDANVFANARYALSCIVLNTNFFLTKKLLFYLEELPVNSCQFQKGFFK